MFRPSPLMPMLMLCTMLALPAVAQEGRAARGPSVPAKMSGLVVDAVAGSPIEYANIVLYRARGGEQVGGTVTKADGSFLLGGLRPGRYRLTISFMGYEGVEIEDLRLPPGRHHNCGQIVLQPKLVEMEGAETVAERPLLAYKIDKKVVDVTRMATAQSGNAVDVLENVPSVEVDIEGNISLRGSTSFTVLIDGRPSILEGSEALQQIPASTIKSIEIITNPAAKYDPEGVAGIVNVILKRRGLEGISGIVNLNVGSNSRYGGDFLLALRRGLVHTFLGADYNIRQHGGYREVTRWTARTDTTTHVESAGDSDRNRTSYGLRAGIDLDLREQDQLSLSGRLGHRLMEHGHDLDFREWSSPGADTSSYRSLQNWERGGNYYQIALDHQHQFDTSGHKVLLRASWSERGGEEESQTELKDLSGERVSGFRSREEGPHQSWELKLDYTLPLRAEDRFEAGWQSRLQDEEDSNEVLELAGDRYLLQPEFSHTTRYQRNTHSAYGLYAGTYQRLGMQAGLRTEHTDREIALEGTGPSFAIDRWDYFPTLHLSYRLPANQQLMASYTRRIRRARGWQLEPFITWTDAYNLRQGNPALEPQRIDSYEAGYQWPFGRNQIAIEGYYRETHDKVERVQSLAPDSLGSDVTLHSYANVGTDYTLGAEMIIDFHPSSWWSISCMGNLQDYRVEGQLFGEHFEQTSLNWGARLNNELNLATGTRIQLNGRYSSPTAQAQGERQGFFRTDLAVKQELIENKLSLTLQVRDLLGSSVHESESAGPGFYSHSRFERDAPVLMLALKYNFNNHKQQRRGGEENGFDEEGQEF